MIREAAIRPKRRVPRIRVDYPVTVSGGWRARCLEIAALGMRIRCQGLLPVGSPIEAVLELQGESIAFSGIVVWRHEPDLSHELPGEMGLVIEQPPQRYLALVSKLFAQADL